VKRILVLATAAAAMASGSVLAAASPTTIAFTSVQTHSTQTMSGFGSRDTDFQGTKRIGHDHIACVFTTRSTAACRAIVVLATGAVKVRFTVGGSTRQGALRVTGGTGAYAGATGTGSFKNLDRAGTRTAVTINLA